MDGSIRWSDQRVRVGELVAKPASGRFATAFLANIAIADAVGFPDAGFRYNASVMQGAL